MHFVETSAGHSCNGSLWHRTLTVARQPLSSSSSKITPIILSQRPVEYMLMISQMLSKLALHYSSVLFLFDSN